jgi:hypothetical protein
LELKDVLLFLFFVLMTKKLDDQRREELRRAIAGGLNDLAAGKSQPLNRKTLSAIRTGAKARLIVARKSEYRGDIRKIFAIPGVLLAFMTIVSCVTSCGGRVVLDPNKIRAQAWSSEIKCLGRTDVRVSTVPQSDESLLFKVENLADRIIFIAYQPSDEEGRARFLSNYLERRESGDTEFKAIEPTPHFGPSPHAIEPWEDLS